MKTDDSKQCSHILMAETDYLFIRSPPPSVLLAKGHSYGFLFGYIVRVIPTLKRRLCCCTISSPRMAL